MNVFLKTSFYSRRTHLYGQGTLQGTVIDKGGNHVSRQIQLWTQAKQKHPRVDMLFLITWSDPKTGQWSFPNLTPDVRFTIIAHDYAGEYDPVMKTNLIPEPME